MIRILSTAAVFAAGGCAPVTLSMTLFAEEGRLHEVVVDSEPRAGDAKVVVIDVRGVIADRMEGGPFTSASNPVDELTAQLRRAEEDRFVKAVILRINSPGGTVTASDMMFREVRRYAARTGRPVVASLGEIAASGGYYLALSCDRIVAEPTSITGSIGVIIPTVNVSDGLSRIGIRSRSITSRPNKDLANPLEPMREEHYAVLQALVDEFYDRFRSLVVERRGPAHAGDGARMLDSSRLDMLTDGRVVTGIRAVDAGLADQTGGLRDAFELCERMADIPAAKLVKYYREDAAVPRSAYAASGLPAASGSESTLLQLRVGMPSAQSPGVYYLWMPPE